MDPQGTHHQTVTDIWTFSEPSVDATNLTGFSVEAVDGGIGKIDEATGENGTQPPDRRYGAVDLRQEGPASCRRRRAGRPGRERPSSSSRTKDEMKNAPEFDADELRDDEAYRGRVGSVLRPRLGGTRFSGDGPAHQRRPVAVLGPAAVRGRGRTKPRVAPGPLHVAREEQLVLGRHDAKVDVRRPALVANRRRSLEVEAARPCR